MDEDIKRFLLWLIVAVILIGSFLAIMFLNSGSGDGGKISGEVGEEEWMKGNPEAKVTLIEYSDFQCPACKAWLTSVNKINAEFSNHIRFVYRHFPLREIHENSQIAAQAAEAAGIQGKFWEMHDMLFEKQEKWSTQSSDQVKELFNGYAKEIGLDTEKFQDDLTSTAARSAVNNDAASGEAANVNSTPSFFLNGVKINPGDDDNFRKLIREAIEQAS